MADESTTWEPTTARCPSCGGEAACEGFGNRVVAPPPGWLVGDPGTDDGPRFLCSRACAEKWDAAETAAWESGPTSRVGTR